MKKDNYFNEKGITLIEVLAVTVLITIIGALSFSVLTGVLEDFNDGTVKSRLFKDAQKIESQLIHVVRNATKIPDNNSFLEIAEHNPNHYTFYSSNDDVIYSFELDGTNLIYRKNNLAFILSSDVEAFSLKEEGDTAKKLIYTIKLARKANGKNVEIELEERSIYFPTWTN